MPPHRASLIATATFAVLTVLTWLAYHAGLNGSFLFDDFVNLSALGEFGRIDNATVFWRYLTSGIADFTGRPLALLSFMIDARDWPANPYPFKRTNLLLHLFNGILLATLLYKLGRITRGRDDRSVPLAAALGAGLWLLHPLFVSTTLYVVQREAMLPATFVLLGLIGYVTARKRIANGRKYGVTLASISIMGGTLLAILCKANGVLLPLLIWIVDALLLAPKIHITNVRRLRQFLWLRRILMIGPSLVVLALLGWFAIDGFISGMPAHRPWTLGERLLTESRIVVEYLGLLWLPRSYTHGLFNDAYPISTSVLAPASTLACIVVLLALGTIAVLRRSHNPAWSTAILFFFAGHLIESSVIPLELYFEHRNYLPALLMFWPLGLWLADAWNKPHLNHLRTLRRMLSIVLPALLAALTFLHADLWGNSAEQGLVWAERNPDSPRAQAWAAQIEMAQGRSARALTRLEGALARHPNELQLAANAADAQCALNGLTDTARQQLSIALANDRRPGRLSYQWIGDKLEALARGERGCTGLNLEVISQLLDSLARNPIVISTPGRQSDLNNLRGRVLLLSGDAEAALTSFNTAIDAEAAPASALRQAVLLASADHPGLGLRHLEHFQALPETARASRNGMPLLHAWLLKKQNYWKNELDRMHTLLSEEAKEKGMAQ